MGNGPRRPDDLPQESPARGLCLCRDCRPPARRRRGGHPCRRVARPPPPGKELERVGNGWMAAGTPRPVDERTFFSNGSHVAWGVPAGFDVAFAGEGEWKITLDVFRDLGLAFGAAMIAIYVLLVAQMGSFTIPLVVMLAIPLDDPGRHARLLAAQRLECPAGGRIPRSGLLHGHGHDRHDCLGGHRDPRLDHPGRLHPPLALPRPFAVRRDHGKPRGAICGRSC